MYISISHMTKKLIDENYKEFTTDEFIEYVHTLAKTVGVEELPEIHFYNESEGAVGVCMTRQILGKTEILALAFYDKLLDGKTYSILQVDETIKHELAHLIANLRYNDDCKHDERFMGVVREIGGEPSECLSLIKNNATFYAEKLKEIERSYQFSLSCGFCGKLHKQTNEYREIFQLFALSGTDNPLIQLIKWGDLGCKSPCCDSCYSLEANVETLLAGLVEDHQLRNFQVYLKELLNK